jgi:hypothetical protein
LKATKLFRLADFSEWGVALTIAYGEKEEDFIKAMDENLHSQNAADIENNIVADAFLAHITGTLDFAGATEEKPKKYTPNEIFMQVTNKAAEMGINIKNTKRWPSAANGFTRRLNDSKNALIACHWNFEISHNGTSREMAIWRIKTEKESEPPTQTKTYCYNVCDTYDTSACPFKPSWQSVNQRTEKPLKCEGYRAKTEEAS